MNIEEWMKQWSDMVHKEETNTDDFWIETPVGIFKNPKFIPNETDEIGEINITIQYDEWDKTKDDQQISYTAIGVSIYTKLWTDVPLADGHIQERREIKKVEK